MRLADLHVRQRDGVSCGPAAAVVAGALLDPDYGADLADPTWFADEQARVHAVANRIWPLALGTTPWGMASVLNARSARYGVRYGWRLRGRGAAGVDVRRAVAANWPVAMLIGNVVPRHWVLIVECDGQTLGCYEPSSGAVIEVSTALVRGARLSALGFPRAFAVVLPRYRVAERHSNI